MEHLIQAVRDRATILFVGAGVSKNLGLPTFGDLVDQLAGELGFDPEVFRLFGQPPALAEFYFLKKSSLGPLRSWMDRAWHSASVDIKQSRVHKAVVELGCPIIYTTNYDRWIEYAFDAWQKPYVKITSV